MCRAQDQAQEAKPSDDKAEAAVAKSSESSSSRPPGEWVQVITPEEFPKGVRKEVRVGGVDVLIFWYRNEIFAIESKSPAEGAYSEGFISSSMNQDYCIQCPGTGSMFNFRTGEVTEWYPSNIVLRFLTPQSTCRKLERFPVRLESDAILIDIAGSNASDRDIARGSGGSMAMFGNDNVYSVETKPYIEPQSDKQLDAGAVATNVVGLVGAAALLVAGTATFKYWESDIGVYLFWAAYVAGGILIASRKVKL